MPHLPERLNAGQGTFGDVVTQPNAQITAAPQVTRFTLWALRYDPFVDIDEDGLICVGGQVWYQPIDLTDAGVLICAKVRDLRPLVIQAEDQPLTK